MTSAVSSEKAEWEKKRAEQQLALDNREKELSERSEELARAEQIVNEQAEINAKSAERNLALASQIEQAGLLIEKERRELMNQKNSPHEYYGEIIFEKNTEINSKEAEIVDLYSTISDKDSKIAGLDAFLTKKKARYKLSTVESSATKTLIENGCPLNWKDRNISSPKSTIKRFPNSTAKFPY